MHLDVLDDKRRAVFSRLRNFPEFSLVGGTALALQIGHRRSADFDLFWEKEIPPALLAKVESVFGKERIVLATSNIDDLSVLADGVKVSFIYYPFSVFSDFVEFDGVRLLSPRIIAIMKAYTIGRRKSYRDYVDFYFLFSGKHATLEETIKGAEKTYKNEFNTRLFLEQLIYLDDVPEAPMDFLKEAVTKNEMQQYFEGLVEKFSWEGS